MESMTATIWSWIKWGVVWGLTWGFALLAQEIVHTHYMSGTSWEAIKMAIVMGAIFAFLGAGIAIGLYVIAVIVRVNSATHAGLITGILTMPVYVALGAAIYFAKFRTIGGADWYNRAALLAGELAIIGGVAIGFLQLASKRADPIRRSKALMAVAIVTAIGSVLAFLISFPSPSRAATEAHALNRLDPSASSTRPLLVIGIDGGTWHAIQPLIDQKRLPTFASIIGDGIHGDVKALWPPYWSVAAWGAIATGHSREDVGVFGDVNVKVPGLPVFQSPMELDPALIPITAIEYVLASRRMIHSKIPDRASLMRPPVWEMLDRSGIKTAVVRFNFSYPGTNQAAIVVSNLAMADVWGLVGVRVPDSAGLVEPASRRDELLAPFARQWKGDSAELVRILPQKEWPRPRDASLNPVGILKGALHFDAATVVTATKVMQTDPDIRVLFVHLGGVDNIEHAFWQYRFPNEFKRRPDQKDVEVLGPVIDRYLEFIDGGMHQMIDAFPTQPNVLIVSDHGQAAREDGVPFNGWHASPGIFLAAGPDIAHHTRKLNVSYYDIVPTILALENLAKPSDLRGRSVLIH
jgi:hypothetical protein